MENYCMEEKYNRENVTEITEFSEVILSGSGVCVCVQIHQSTIK